MLAWGGRLLLPAFIVNGRLEQDEEDEEVEVLADVAVLYVESLSESESEGVLSVWELVCV